MTEFTPSSAWTHDRNDYDNQSLTNGRFRVRIERDQSPQEPEFEAGCPVVQIDTSRSYESVTATMTGYGASTTYTDGLPREASEIIEYFASEFGGKREGIDIFERYLKIWHDGNLVEYGPHQQYTDYTYVAYITRTLWESWGNGGQLTPEGLAQEVGKADMTEWQAYLESDVWGVITEKLATWVKLDDDGKVTESTDRWEEIEDEEGPCWGFYGEDVAKEEAEMSLNVEVDSARGYSLRWGHSGSRQTPFVELRFHDKVISSHPTMEAGRAALEAHAGRS